MTHISHRQPRAHLDTELLSAYLDNQVTPAERARVEAHLRVCMTCQAELNSLRQTVTLLRALPRVPVPRAFTLSEAQAGLRRQPAQRGWLGGWLPGLAAATAVVLIAVVTSNLLGLPAWAPRQDLARQFEATAIPAAPAPMLAAPQEEVTALAEVAPAVAGEETAQPPAPAEVTSMPVAEVPLAALAPAGTAPASTEVPAEAPAIARAAATEVSQLPTAEKRASTAMVPSAPLPPPEAGAAGMGMDRSGAPSEQATATIASPAEPLPPPASFDAILPQGAGLAYADQQGLWAVDRESGVRQVVQGAGLTLPLISHDRSWIAYRLLQQGAWEVWVVRWDGGGAHLVLSERDLPRDGLAPDFGKRQLHALQWIPGRPTLAVTTIALPLGPEGAPRFDLWHQEVVSGTLAYVRQMEPTETAFYSPDGTHLAVLNAGGVEGQEGSLTLLSSDGSGSRVLLRFPATIQASEPRPQVQWLPDSSGMLVAIADSGANPANNEAEMALYRITVAGEATPLGRLLASALFWSPNGQRLAYMQSANGTPNSTELVVAQADGSQAQSYALLRDGQFIAWSPDAAHFLYRSADQLYVGTVGLPPQLVGSRATIFDPRWISPTQFLYLYEVTGGANGLAQVSWALISQTVSGQAYTLAIFPQQISLDLVATSP